MGNISVVVIWLMVGCISLAFGQSGAPNLLQFHGRLVHPATNQPITVPALIHVQVIQGGTAEENPTTGRIVFAEQAEVTPDENGRFDYLIGSHAPGIGTGRARLEPEDFNTTRPVFIEIALVELGGSAQTMLPRQRLGSIPFALQAADAAVDERLVNVDGDTMTGPLKIDASLSVGSGGPAQGAGDAFIAGTLQIGPSSLVLNGSGIKFPDMTFQSTAGLASVQHDASLIGNGMIGFPLGIAPAGVSTTQLADGAVTSAKLSLGAVGMPQLANGAVGTTQLIDGAVTAAKIAPGQVVKSLNGLMDNVTLVGAGPNITVTPSGNMLTIAAPNSLSSVAHNATLTGNGTSGLPLSVAVPLSLAGSAGLPTAILSANNSNSGPGLTGISTSGPGVYGESANSTKAGVLGFNSSGTGVRGESISGNGVFGTTNNSSLAGVHGEGSDSNVTGVRGISISGFGVHGTSSDGPGVSGQSVNGIGVRGISSSGFGVTGVSLSDDAIYGSSASSTKAGVHGENTFGGVGVFGESPSGVGIYGVSSSCMGVFGFSFSGPGIVGTSTSSNLFEGRSAFGLTLLFRVTNGGQVRSNVGFTTPAADFAEMTEVEEASGHEVNSYQPGDVLTISPETGKLKKCSQPYSSLVAGVYSTEPGFLGGQGIEETSAGSKVPLALIGRVPCKVTTENGPIQIGDLLVTSSTPGYAMRGTDRSLMLGAIVGKALERLPSGTGTIRVLVTLQ